MKSLLVGRQVFFQHRCFQRVSCFGVISKNNQSGKLRLILDLSSPEGQSGNDGIPKPPFTVQYISVDDFIDGIMTLGRGTLMAKFDVANAYQNVAIHPDDRRPKLAYSGVGNILWIWCFHLDCVQHHLSLLPLRIWLNGFRFTIMMSPSSIITWMISSPLAHHLRLSASTTFKPVFICVINLAYPFIQVSWRVL